MLTIEEATARLRAILGRVEPSLNDTGRSALRRELLELIDDDDLPLGPEFEKLRAAARVTFEELGRRITDAAIARIRSRSDDLIGHAQAVSAVAGRAEESAKRVRLEMLGRVVRATTEAIGSVQAVKLAVDQGDLPAASGKLEAAIEALLELQRGFADPTTE